MLKVVNTPVSAKPTGTTSSSGSGSGSGGDTSNITLASLGGVPLALIGAPNGLPQLDQNKKLNQQYLDLPDGNSNVITKIAPVSLSVHRVMIIDQNNSPGYADNNNVDHINRVVGVSVNSANAGGSLQIQQSGELTDPSFNLIPGPVYVGSNGFITTDIPDEQDAIFLQQIGIATSATTIVINIATAFKLN